MLNQLLNRSQKMHRPNLTEISHRFWKVGVTCSPFLVGGGGTVVECMFFFGGARH